MMRIAIFVSGGGSNLQALIDAQGSIIKSGKITLVVSSKPGVFALERAKNAGIKTEVIERKGISADEFSQKAEELLVKNNIDIIVTAGFLTVLCENITKKYKNRIINVHPSLIPNFCGKGYYGMRVHEEVLKAGVKTTGATAHYVNEIIDGGDIILQKSVDVKDVDTPEILQKRVMEEAEWVILPEAVELVCKQMRNSECGIRNAKK